MSKWAVKSTTDGDVHKVVREYLRESVEVVEVGKDIISYRINCLSGDKDGDMLGYIGLCPKQTNYEE